MYLYVAILSALFFGTAGFLMKWSAHHKGSLNYLLLGLYLSGSICFLILSIVNQSFQLSLISIPIILSGIIVGIGSTFGNILFMKALEIGPSSITSPLVNSNIILVIVGAVLIYGETLSQQEIVGIILIVCAVFLLPIDRNESLAIKNRRWYLLIFLAIILFAFRNGGLKVTQELNLPNDLILFIAYTLSLLYFLIVTIFQREEKKAQIKGLWIGLLTGIFSFLGLWLYAFALAIGPASIVSPIFSANAFVLVIMAFIYFKERISMLQLVSIILLFIGLISLRLTF